MVSCINEVTVESRRSPFTSHQSTDVSFHFKAPGGPIQRGEGRRRGERLPCILSKRHKWAEVCLVWAWKPIYFRLLESINARIILWIPLFRVAKWLGHPCMKPISNFQSETHPRTTYRPSFKTACAPMSMRCKCVCACLCICIGTLLWWEYICSYVGYVGTLIVLGSTCSQYAAI